MGITFLERPFLYSSLVNMILNTALYYRYCWRRRVILKFSLNIHVYVVPLQANKLSMNLHDIIIFVDHTWVGSSSLSLSAYWTIWASAQSATAFSFVISLWLIICCAKPGAYKSNRVSYYFCLIFIMLISIQCYKGIVQVFDRVV